MEFVVEGDPVAAGRPRFARVGPGVRTFMPKANEAYCELVRMAFNQQVTDEPFERGIPLELSASVYFKRPKSHYGTGRNADVVKRSSPIYHTQKPDIDNLLKLIKDALGKGYAFHDDSQIVRYGRVEKRWCDCRPRTEITIVPAAH